VVSVELVVESIDHNRKKTIDLHRNL